VSQHLEPLYADDAAVFVAPYKGVIQYLSSILISFGEVAILHTNFQKSSVVPICCEQINLNEVLESLPAERTPFPMRYLGLPLSNWWLRRVDYQHIEDKAAAKITTWNGKYINMTDRTALVKSVLTSQALPFDTTT
jgi:hypothetical protein